jgi:hypothetical protein
MLTSEINKIFYSITLLVCGTIFIGVLYNSARADVIMLHDGTIMNGKITVQKPDSITFVNYYGTFTIKRSLLNDIHITGSYKEDVEIYKKAGKSVSVTDIERNFTFGVKNYFEIKTDPDGITKIRWGKIEEIVRYDVEIKDKIEKPVLNKKVDSIEIEFAIPEGSYRFRIGYIGRDEKISGWSEWRDFNVEFPPEIKSITRSSGVSGDRVQGIGIKGRNFVKGMRIHLRKGKEELEAQNVEYKSRDLVEFNLNLKDVKEGEYTLVVSKPFGSDASMKNVFTVESPLSESFSLKTQRRISIAAAYLSTIGSKRDSMPGGYGVFLSMDIPLRKLVFNSVRFYYPDLRVESGYLFFGSRDQYSVHAMPLSAGPVWFFPVRKDHMGRVLLSFLPGITYIKRENREFGYNSNTFSFSTILGYEYPYGKVLFFCNARYFYLYDFWMTRRSYVDRLSYPLLSVGTEIGAGYMF